MNELHKHILGFCDLNNEQFELVRDYFEYKRVSKKETLYEAGSNNLGHFFVVKGCLHMYLINERGSQQTLQFAIDNWWLTDHQAFRNRTASEFYIQAVEASEVLIISNEKQADLLQRFPQMEVYFRNIYAIAYGAAIMRMKYIFTYTKEEIYFKFRDAFPEFVNNVPQYLVATYLGLSPEYVSKLRRKDVS
ncbi:Crp/Fnr family transcriptional regulator [Euzebyella marina]|uniref:Crp/Fnr family transcriptional regulator n=1 Tax=Euzebyella marina TaxID=1761453 RepID=A0A3G2L5X7_9FLAO|nr:Crp/Fnr family transcriptional regulator [Euzebyella marina]AYN67672.1 Crp/Fnr family transcriptional regulator [Euzebyella marina]